MSAELQSEGERLAFIEQKKESIDKLDEAATSPDITHAEAIQLQSKMDTEKKELYENMTDEERIARIEEFLEEHEEMYEMSDGEYAVTLDSVLTPWGEVPRWGDLSSYIKEELLRIKSENPWIQDSDYGKDQENE